MVEQPLGPRKLPVSEQQPDDFEQLCHRLVLLDFPDAVRPCSPDGGADSLLPRPEGGWRRAWQAKRFTGHIRWGQCKESLDAAVKNYEIEHMTFCFARSLTVRQQQKFQKDLAGRHPGVRVDFWDLDQLLARLNGSEAGERIARHFFGDSAHDEEAMLRAIRAGGPLTTADSVIERSMPLAEHLAGHDPYFTYPMFEFEDGVVIPSTPGAMMSVLRSEGGKHVRIDALARDRDAAAEYGPKLRIEFDPDAVGAAAAKAMDDAVRKGEAVTIEAGVQVTAEQLPPLFGDRVGKSERAKLILTPTGIAPWRAVCRAETDRGSGEIRVDLRRMARPPAGWQAGFRGQSGGLALTVKGQIVGDRPELTISWRHCFDDAPAHEQVAALRFLDALHGTGVLTITDEDGVRPALKHSLETQEFDLDGLLQLMEDVVAIEDWSKTSISIPDEITPIEAGWVRTIANAIQTGELHVNWESAQAVVETPYLPSFAERKAVRIQQDMEISLLGQPIAIGRGTLDLPEVEAEDLGPVHGNPNAHTVRLRPVGGPPLATTWRLVGPGSRAPLDEAASQSQ